MGYPPVYTSPRESRSGKEIKQPGQKTAGQKNQEGKNRLEKTKRAVTIPDRELGSSCRRSYILRVTRCATYCPALVNSTAQHSLYRMLTHRR